MLWRTENHLPLNDPTQFQYEFIVDNYMKMDRTFVYQMGKKDAHTTQKSKFDDTRQYLY